MIVTIDDLKETATLAHLPLDESELEKMFPAFEQMLEYFTMMKNADDDRAAFPNGLDDFSYSRAVSFGSFRSDIECSSSENKTLINNAAEHDGHFIMIPNVL